MCVYTTSIVLCTFCAKCVFCFHLLSQSLLGIFFSTAAVSFVTYISMYNVSVCATCLSLYLSLSLSLSLTHTHTHTHSHFPLPPSLSALYDMILFICISLLHLVSRKLMPTLCSIYYITGNQRSTESFDSASETAAML